MKYITGETMELVNNMNRSKIDIACLQEIKWRARKTMKLRWVPTNILECRQGYEWGRNSGRL